MTGSRTPSQTVNSCRSTRVGRGLGVRVAIAPDRLAERERTYAVVTSEPYLLVVSAGEACLSGIEAAGDPASAALRFPSRMVVTPFGQRSWRGTRSPVPSPQMDPTASALSDFVVQIEPELGTQKYRTNEVTFDAR
jgi:hypothetical protein